MYVFWRTKFIGKYYRQLSVLALLMCILVQFQNCGKGPGSAAAVHVSPRSPFYSQRVYIDASAEDEQVMEKMAADDSVVEVKANLGVTVLIHNGCALKECDLNKEGSIACSILESSKIFDKLENSVQAYSWQLPDESMNSEALEKLISENTVDNQCIVGVSLNREYKTEGVNYPTNDPGIASQYYHKTINGPDAYDFFYGKPLSQVTVGVIDSGVQPEHEDIYYGAVNVNLSASCTKVCHWHGNFVSSIINAKRGNGKGGHGIAPNAYIYAFQIGDENGRLTSTELVNALQMANAYNVEIINMSLGGSALRDYALQDGMIKAIDKGTIIVVAAGNNGRDLTTSPFYPASFNFDGQINVGSASPEAINDLTMTVPFSMTATQSDLKRDFYSNYGSGLIHIAAPGKGVYAAGFDHTYSVSRGTSFAAPMVTGALALIKGYIKSKGMEISPEVLRSLLLEGSRTEPKLKETINGSSADVFQNSRFLDLVKLKDTVVQYTDRVNLAPARIEVVSSGVVTINGAKSVKITVDVRDGNLSDGLILKAYTNKAFLTESQVQGYECKILSVRQVCEIIVSYSQLLIDPGVYLRVSNSSGMVISDLSIAKSAIQLGDKTTSTLKGEIIAAYHTDRSFQIEGWSCLPGFADAIEIQVRLGSNSGTPITSISTNRQGRGNYFATCDSPEINFGFRYTLPEHYLASATPLKFFFKAVHPETGKQLDLPVYTYQPKFQDTKPAVYWDHVYVDPNLADRGFEVKYTRKEFKNFILTLEGSACFRSSRKPAAFTLGLENVNFRRLFPQFRNLNKYFQTGNSEVSSLQASDDPTTFEILGISRSIQAANMNTRKIDSEAGMFGALDDFSEVLDIMTYVPYEGASATESKGALVYAGDSGKPETGFLTITPDIELGDGCHYPSGFKVSVDIRPYIVSTGTSFSLSYRKDKYTEAQVMALPDLQIFKDLFSLSSVTTVAFSSLVFDPKAFNIAIQSVVVPKKAFHLYNHYELFKSGSFSKYYDDAYNGRLTTGWRALASDANRTENRYAAITYRDWHYRNGVTFSSSLPDDRGFLNPNLEIWATPLSVQLTESMDMTLKPVHTTEIIPLKNSGMGNFFPLLTLVEGKKFGELNTDFRIQVRYNGTGLWYDLEVEDTYTHGDTGAVKVGLSGDSTYPAGTTSVQMRILANGKNHFKITSMGYYAE